MKKKVKQVKHKTTVDGLKTTLHTKPVASLPIYKCKNPKCGHQWMPRTNMPLVCPRCHRPWAG